MSKQDFIKKFELKKGNKNYFRDGRTIIERVVYYNKYGNKYMTWKNGNITYVDMDDDKKENEENVSDDKIQQNVR